MLEVDVKPVDIPNQNLLAYFTNENSIFEKSKDIILFFIDPMNGQIYTHKHILEYLKKIEIEYQIDLIMPMSAVEYTKKWLYGIAKVYKAKGELLKFSSIVQLADKIADK
jgi:hypothetical protein